MTKVAKRVMACGLAFALVVSGSGFSSGTVSAKAKTKKVSVTVGKTKKLTVSKPKKKVTWKTSNKKVVKITKTSGTKKKTATIKGVKKGTATVTAKSGKTKTTFKVTVKAAATNIKSISVDMLDSSCLVLQLKKKAAVNVSDLTIGLKNYNEGAYNYTPTVKTLTTTDQITYRIYLSTGISNGKWVKLTLNKKDVKEIQYKREIAAKNKEAENELMEKDDTYSLSCGSYFTNTIGNVKYTVKEGTLPAGVEINSKKGLIKGIPNTVGTYPVTIQAKDELGRTGTAVVNFIVYDKTVIVCPNSTQDVRLDDYAEARLADASTNKIGETVFKSFKVTPYGGSGSYKYTLAAPDVANVRLSTDVKDSATGQITPVSAESTRLILPYEITEGAHTYTITITDNVNPQLTATTTVTVNAVKYFNIKGTAKDVNGAPLSGNRLYFIPVAATSFSEYVPGYSFAKKDAGNDYDYDYDTSSEGDSYYYLYKNSYTARVGTSSTDTTIGKQKGTYSAELAPGEYIVKIYSDSDGIDYQMSTTITVGAADAMQDVVAPVRFYSISGMATYANGSAVTEEYIYFELKDEQYEYYSDYNFAVKTDAAGAFIASLPANKYVAYILDEKGQRKYFNTEISVVDADITLTEFKLPITRYIVSGTASNETAPLKETNLYIYNPDGDCRTVKTDATGAFKIALSGAPAPGITYTIKAYINGTYRILGTVIVQEADVAGLNLVYSFANEVAAAAQVTFGSDLALTSNGTNDMYAKVVVAEGEAGYYQFRANSAVYISNFRLYVYDDKGSIQYSDNESGTYVSFTKYLSAGTYYVKVLPQNWSSADDDYVQAVGTFSLNVAKDTSYGDPTTPNTPAPAPTSSAPAPITPSYGELS